MNLSFVTDSWSDVEVMPTKKRRNRKQQFTVADSIRGGSKNPLTVPAAAMADPLGSKARIVESSGSVCGRSFKIIAIILLVSLSLCLAVAFAIMYAVANSSSATLPSSGKVNMGKEKPHFASFFYVVGFARTSIDQQLRHSRTVSI